MSEREQSPSGFVRGPIAWMVNSRIAPNLLMVLFIVGGLMMSSRVKQEVFPEFDLDRVTISVVYPGASPEEIEQGVILVVEEAVRGVDGVKEIGSTARESVGLVTVELVEGKDAQRIYQDIQQQVDRILTFPEEIEEPQIALATRRRNVLAIQLYGNADEWVLRELAESVRDRLLQSPGITQVELSGVRDYEIAVEVPLGNLRAYGLTLDDVARIIRQSAVELPGGSIKTSGQEILLRVRDRRDWARQFAEVAVVSEPGGSVLRLGDIATVTEGFEDTDRMATYGGHPAIGILIDRVGDQTPIGVSEAAATALAELKAGLPPGIDYVISSDRSEIYRQRLDLLLKNAFIGLGLVLLLLGTFLKLRLAFWVTMGIPISFLGTVLFMPSLDVSINMISMFGFILALGIVVDDAIIAGENIYEYQQQGMDFVEAAIKGAGDITKAVSFSIITNIVAFMPLLFVPGLMGKFFRVIPVVVITAFAISWVEALFILPAHLAHEKNGGGSNRVIRHLERWQGFASGALTRFRDSYYEPLLQKALGWRYVTIAIGAGVLVLALTYVFSGRIGIVLMSRIESDQSVATITLPSGTTLGSATEVRDRVVAAAQEIAKENGGTSLVSGVFANIDGAKIEVISYLTAPDVRPIQTGDFTRLWRGKVGLLPGVESMLFESNRGGPGRGKSLTVELSHRDFGVLERASSDLAAQFAEFANTTDIDDGYSPGKQQIDFSLGIEGRSLGLTSNEIARQIRNSYQGRIALRQQRGRNEVTVRVRLPENERDSHGDIEQLYIRTPGGGDVRLSQIAHVQRGNAYTAITRRNARRTVTVGANVVPDSETNQIQATLVAEVFPALIERYPGLTAGFEGRQADMSESTSSLFGNFILAMLVIYALLAIPFRSYAQPLIVMAAIPFGIVGAIIGHLVMGYPLSLMSMMGIVALSGVVVNDSLIVIDYANTQRDRGASAYEAITQAGLRRLRPVILTTLTTYGGLAPMIFETSRQAKFIIPMAVSLGYGILFATGITLILVPCLYLALDDLVGAGARHVPATNAPHNQRPEPTPA